VNGIQSIETQSSEEKVHLVLNVPIVSCGSGDSISHRSYTRSGSIYNFSQTSRSDYYYYYYYNIILLLEKWSKPSIVQATLFY